MQTNTTIFLVEQKHHLEVLTPHLLNLRNEALTFWINGSVIDKGLVDFIKTHTSTKTEIINENAKASKHSLQFQLDFAQAIENRLIVNHENAKIVDVVSFTDSYASKYLISLLNQRRLKSRINLTIINSGIEAFDKCDDHLFDINANVQTYLKKPIKKTKLQTTLELNAQTTNNKNEKSSSKKLVNIIITDELGALIIERVFKEKGLKERLDIKGITLNLFFPEPLKKQKSNGDFENF